MSKTIVNKIERQMVHSRIYLLYMKIFLMKQVFNSKSKNKYPSRIRDPPPENTNHIEKLQTNEHIKCIFHISRNQRSTTKTITRLHLPPM